MLNRRAFLTAAPRRWRRLARARSANAQGAGVTRRSIRGLSANDPDLAAMRRAVAAMKRASAIRCTQLDTLRRHPSQFLSARQLVFPAVASRLYPRLRAHLPGMSGKRDFALPYWNWTSDRQFPAAFAAGDRNSNPLFIRARRRRRHAAARRHGRPAGDLAHHEQPGLRGLRQHAAARPGQRGGVMAAPARLRRPSWSSIRTTACIRRSAATWR